MTLDVAANRARPRYTRGENLARVLWALATPLFRLSPRPCFAWRRLLLRLFGARVGTHVNIYPSTRIVMPWNLEIGDWSAIGEEVLVYNLGRVTIGAKVTISLRAFLCTGTHDHTRPDFPLVKDPIRVGDQAWLCADSFIGPGVDVGEGAIVAARAVAVKSVSRWTIVGGNPARQIGERPPAGKRTPA